MKLPLVDACVDRLHKALTEEPADSLWGILGPPTAGKSTALRRLHEKLTQEANIVSVLVSPPAGALDAAPLATIEVGGRLHDANFMNGELQSLLDPARSWADKLALLEGCLNRNRDNIVLLCDEHNQWRVPYEDDHWGRCVQDVTSLLIDR
ncbi:MAG: hypothetical protein ACYCW6_31100, partial [Candidatus Xenobia bacterium]